MVTKGTLHCLLLDSIMTSALISRDFVLSPVFFCLIQTLVYLHHGLLAASSEIVNYITSASTTEGKPYKKGRSSVGETDELHIEDTALFLLPFSTWLNVTEHNFPCYKLRGGEVIPFLQQGAGPGNWLQDWIVVAPKGIFVRGKEN